MPTLDHPFFRRDGLSDGVTSGSWVTDTQGGTATELLPSNFTAGNDYLILCACGVQNASRTALPGARVVTINSSSQVQTVFANSEARFEIGTLDRLWPYFFFHKWTAVSGQGLALQHFPNGNQARSYHTFLVALDITGLTNHFDINTTSSALSLTPATNGASVTFTPGANETWMYLYLDRLQPLQNNQSVVTRRFATPISTIEYAREEGEQSPNDRVLHSFMEIRTEGGSPGSVTIRPESFATVNSNGGNRLGSQVFAMPLDQFDFFKTQRLSGSVQGTDPYSLSLLSTNWQGGDPNPNDDALVLAMMTFDPNGTNRHMLFSTRNAGGTPYRTGTETDARNWGFPHDATGLLQGFELFDSVVDGTARTWQTVGSLTSGQSSIGERSMAVLSTSAPPSETPVSNTEETYITTRSPVSGSEETYVSNSTAPIAATEQTYVTTENAVSQTQETELSALQSASQTEQTEATIRGRVAPVQQTDINAGGKATVSNQTLVTTFKPITASEETYYSSLLSVGATQQTEVTARGRVAATETPVLNTGKNIIPWFTTKGPFNEVASASVSGASEWSGCTYIESRNQVLMVNDGPPTAYKRVDEDGVEVDALANVNWVPAGATSLDLEAIEYLRTSDNYAIVHEASPTNGDPAIGEVSIPPAKGVIADADVSPEHILDSVPTFSGLPNGINDAGMEGVCFDQFTGKYYGIVQSCRAGDTQAGVWEFDPSGPTQTFLFQNNAAFVATGHISATASASDLAWGGGFAGAPCLFVHIRQSTLGEANSAKIIQCLLDGTVIDTFDYSGSATGQVEGLAFNELGTKFWLVKEDAGTNFWRFDNFTTLETVIDYSAQWFYDDSDVDRFNDQANPFHHPSYNKATSFTESQAPLGFPNGPAIADWDPAHPDQDMNTIVTDGDFISYYFIKDVTINNVDSVTRMDIDQIADDGQTLYLNGTSIATLRSQTNPSHDTVATATAGSPNEGIAVRTTITDQPTLDLLVEGSNRFAMYGCQVSTGSSDFVVDLRVILTKDSSEDLVAGSEETYITTQSPIAQTEATELTALGRVSATEQTEVSTLLSVSSAQQAETSSRGRVAGTEQTELTAESPVSRTEEAFLTAQSPVAEIQATEVSSLQGVSDTEATEISALLGVASTQETQVNVSGSAASTNATDVTTQQVAITSTTTFLSIRSNVIQGEQTEVSTLLAISSSEQTVIAVFSSPIQSEQTELTTQRAVASQNETEISTLLSVVDTEQTEVTAGGYVAVSEETYWTTGGEGTAVSNSEETYLTTHSPIAETEQTELSTLLSVGAAEQTEVSTLQSVVAKEQTELGSQASASRSEQTEVSSLQAVSRSEQTEIGTTDALASSETTEVTSQGYLSASEQAEISTLASASDSNASEVSILQSVIAAESTDVNALQYISAAESTDYSVQGAPGTVGASEQTYVTTQSPEQSASETYLTVLSEITATESIELSARHAVSSTEQSEVTAQGRVSSSVFIEITSESSSPASTNETYLSTKSLVASAEATQYSTTLSVGATQTSEYNGLGYVASQQTTTVSLSGIAIIVPLELTLFGT